MTVNRIGLGAMRLTHDAARRPSDRGSALRLLRRAVDLGVNHIDTASFYFSDRRSANELINSALSPYPDDLLIVTKVGPGRDAGGDWWWATPEQLRGQVEENLRQLGRDHLDVVNLRTKGRASIAEKYGALAELQRAGLIRHLGISNVTPAHLAEAQEIAPVVCVQNRYGVGASTESEQLVDLCRDQGVAFVPFFAIAGAGREAGAPATDVEGVAAVAKTHGVSSARVRLAWTLHRGPHVLAIPGTSNPDHLLDNLAAGSIRLTADDLAILGAVDRA